jgi:hypothetical protein
VQEEQQEVGLLVEIAGRDRFPSMVGQGKTRGRDAVVLFVKADV